MQSEEIRVKAGATNFERCGAESVFSKESSKFDEVQASLESKSPVPRGEDNPFAQSEVKTDPGNVKTRLAKFLA